MVHPEVSDYIRILYKINEIYTKFNDIEYKDLTDDIDYYTNKKEYSVKEIQDMQDMCISEWKEALVKLSKALITKIESKTKYKKLMKIELKKVKSLHTQITKEKYKLDKYESLFEGAFTDLKDEIDKIIEYDKTENKRFVYGFLLGFITEYFTNWVIGVIVLIVVLSLYHKNKL